MVWAWSSYIMSHSLIHHVSYPPPLIHHVFYPTSKPKSFQAMSLRDISIFRIYVCQGNRVQQAPGPPPVCPGCVGWCGREAVWGGVAERRCGVHGGAWRCWVTHV